jgi:hypothetical protein
MFIIYGQINVMFFNDLLQLVRGTMKTMLITYLKIIDFDLNSI